MPPSPADTAFDLPDRRDLPESARDALRVVREQSYEKVSQEPSPVAAAPDAAVRRLSEPPVGTVDRDR